MIVTKNILENDITIIESEAVELFKKINFAKYDYKDKYKNGSGISYGVIAEELNKTIPDYVDTSSYDFVPNVFDYCDVKKTKKINNFIIKLNKSIVISGLKVQLILEDKTIDLDILENMENQSILVECKEKLSDKVFVYGTYEKCPTVAKNKMFELGMVCLKSALARIENLEATLRH